MENIVDQNEYSALRKKCPYSELFWSLFFRIRTEYREILRISPYSVRMRETEDQNNAEYRYFSRNGGSVLMDHSKTFTVNILI